jgi:hypothetical protein
MITRMKLNSINLINDAILIFIKTLLDYGINLTVNAQPYFQIKIR